MPDKTPDPKQITLTLEYGTHQYKVVSLNDSVEFTPGQWLNRYPENHPFHIPGIMPVEKGTPSVAEIIARPSWKVIITDNQLWAQVMGAISSHISFNPI